MERLLLLLGDGCGERQERRGNRRGGHAHEADRLDITVRYSSETAAINSKQYRVLLAGRAYDILNIDDMGFRHNSRKLHTRLRER